MIAKPLYTLNASELSRLNPPPVEVAEDENGQLWQTHLTDERWQSVGYIPRPRNRWEWFTYHIWHGLAMRYPPHKVLLYAIFNTNPL